MANTPEEELDQRYGPFVGIDEAMPGGWVKEERGLTVWQGISDWRTRHGTAVVCWTYGRSRAVYGATLTDGAVLDRVEPASAIDRVNWRRPGDGDSRRGHGNFVHGAVEIRADGVVFTDGVQPVFEPLPLPGPDEAPNLEAELGRDEEFLRLVQDDGIAAAAWEWFKNRDVRKKGSDSHWHVSWRHAAGFIAQVRRRGETYTDFYPWGGDFGEIDAQAFLAVVERLGWAELTPRELAANHAKAMGLIDEVSRRPTKPPPEWARGYRDPDGVGGFERMLAAVGAGKVEESEWHRFNDLYLKDMDRIAVDEEAQRIAGLFGPRDDPEQPETPKPN